MAEKCGVRIWSQIRKMGQNPIKALHAEFYKSVLRVQRNTPNNACRVELGQSTLVMHIEKQAIKFRKYQKMSDPNIIKPLNEHWKKSPDSDGPEAANTN